eukprot:8076-Pelagococcus_subviridis.AAC.3
MTERACERFSADAIPPRFCAAHCSSSDVVSSNGGGRFNRAQHHRRLDVSWPSNCLRLSLAEAYVACMKSAPGSCSSSTRPRSVLASSCARKFRSNGCA